MSEQPLLSGRYRVGRLIGHGGMGDVYLGTDTRLGRTVAIKLLRPQLADDPIFQKRFRNETTAAARMISPYIVRTYDAGQDMIATGPNARPQEVPFLVMEYVEGQTLKEKLAKGTIDRAEALKITDQVLRALEYSHRANIIHRDIKPGNIMITSSGDAKVMDFGVARALSESEGTIAQTGSVVGTALYFAPEQARGDRVDGRSDLYSVGVILYEMLVGRVPFKGDSPASIAYQHVNATAPTPSSLNDDLGENDDRVILSALAKDPTRRYQTAEDFRADVDRLAQGVPTRGPSYDAASTLILEDSPIDDALDLDPEDDDPSSHFIDRELRKGGIGTIWAIVIGVGVIGVIAVLWLALLQPRIASPEGAQVAVPNLAGATYQTAEQQLKDRGLNPVKVDQTDDSVSPGRVIETDPPAGALALAGSDVQVKVSSGAPMVTIPDVSKLTQDEATKKLTDAGLQVGQITQVINGDVPAGQVIASEPTAQSQVRSGTSVRLQISSGRVVIPGDLVGKPINDAISQLRDLGLSARPQPVRRCQASSYTVQFSDPKPGTELAANASTEVILYYYMADSSKCAPPPTPSSEAPAPESSAPPAP
ncbi:MAG: Stk1 family PASTA domain-containing Ser/Thr kinase [Pseudoclavibacter sp.]